MSDAPSRDRVPGPPVAPIPVTLLTGFLGSGKTTLLNAALRDPALAGSAVLINEFGSVGLDHLLVETLDEQTVLLDSGCLCCTVRGDLVRALHDLAQRRALGEVPPFERVIVETTGLADPAPILHTLIQDPAIAAAYRLDGVVTTVDAEHGARQLSRHFESVKQAAVADLVVITKADLAAPEALDRLERRLARLAPRARRIVASHGALPATALVGLGLFDPATRTPDVARWLREEAARDAVPDAHAGHVHDPDRHDHAVGSFSLAFDRALPWDAVIQAFEMLTAVVGDGLLRVKAVIDVEGESRPRVLHVVQHQIYPPATLPAWPPEWDAPGCGRRSRFVFVTRLVERDYVAGVLSHFVEAPVVEPEPAAA